MCSRCEWEEFLEDLDEMMDDDRYYFAIDTLEGIKEWVEDEGHVTEKQRVAVSNIRDSIDD